MSADDQPQPATGGNSSQYAADSIRRLTNGDDVIVAVETPTVHAVICVEPDAGLSDVDDAMEATWDDLEDVVHGDAPLQDVTTEGDG